MKRFNVTILMLLFGVTSVFSQLQVDSTGYVGVGVTDEILEDEEADSIMSPFAVRTAGSNNVTASFVNGLEPTTVYIHNKGTGDANSTGLSSSANSSNGNVQGVFALAMSTINNANNDKHVVGVKGLTYMGDNAAGILGGPFLSVFNENFAGVYGSVTNSEPVFLYSGQYAGYFDGTVRSTGAIYAQAYYLTSTNLTNGYNNGEISVSLINDEERVTDKLRNVSSFEVQHNSTLSLSKQSIYVEDFLNGKDIKDLSVNERLQLDSICSSIAPTEKDPLASVNYGLDAEQLKAMFPKLVQQDKEGNYSINYIEMIPLLVKSINELSEELEELKGASRNKSKALSETTIIEDNVSEVDMVRMNQNKPNPFSESTVIGLSIPEKTQKANIFIYDLSGKQIKNVPVSERGETNITVYASELGAGMYIYTLVVDGKVVVTSRMIVEK